MSYVHLNPLSIFEPRWQEKREIDIAKAMKFLKSFRYSSYPDYFHESRLASKIIDKHTLPINVSDLESITKMLSEYHTLHEGSIQGLPLDRVGEKFMKTWKGMR